MIIKPSIASCTRALVLFIFSSSILILLRYLYFASYGLDFTDEGFYLNWYKYPETYPAVVTFFGFVYAIPYRFLGENISALRIFNILTILTCGSWFVYQPFLRMKGFEKLVGGPLLKATFIFSLSTLSLLSVARYSSPSYNHLAFIGCLLVTGALIKSGPLDESPQVFRFSVGLPLISGIVAASLAKPTTGFVLGLVSLLYSFSLSKSSRRGMILWLTISLLLIVCISASFVGSISELFFRVTFGTELVSLLGAGHNLDDLLASIWGIFLNPPPLLVVAFVLIFQVSVAFAFLSHKQKYGLIAKRFLIAYSLSIAFVLFANYRWFISAISLQIGAIWLIAFAISFPTLFAANKCLYFVGYWQNLQRSSFVYLCRLLLLLVIPVGFGFGSNNTLWSKIFTISIIFLSVAAIFLVKLSLPDAKRVFPAFLLCVAIGQILLLPAHGRFLLAPYGQPQPLFFQNTLTRVGPSSHLHLSQVVSDYIKNAHNALMQNGYKSGSPFLDLSARSPGLIYAIDGRPIGNAWMMGGPKGAPAVARAVLANVSCDDLRSSWLFVDPDDPGNLNSILDDFEIDIHDESRYQKVAHLMTPKGVSSSDSERSLFIYKPLIEAGTPNSCFSRD